ncbi:hypothetical protein JXR93_01870 [bacterium]|nr:hypothetical protein [bacterium]
MDHRGVIFILLISFFSHTLFAGDDEKIIYPLKKEIIYSTMVRYLAIDNEAKISEKDIEGAYIIFSKDDKEEIIIGKIELIEREEKKTEMKIKFEGAIYKKNRFLKKFKEKLEEEQDIKIGG